LRPKSAGRATAHLKEDIRFMQGLLLDRQLNEDTQGVFHSPLVDTLVQVCASQAPGTEVHTGVQRPWSTRSARRNN
jgi:hypothetical protein